MSLMNYCQHCSTQGRCATFGCVHGGLAGTACGNHGGMAGVGSIVFGPDATAGGVGRGWGGPITWPHRDKCSECPTPSECAPHGCARMHQYDNDLYDKLKKALEAAQVKPATPAEPSTATALPAMPIVPVGWLCPCCQTVMAPHVSTCVNCQGKAT